MSGVDLWPCANRVGYQELASPSLLLPISNVNFVRKIFSTEEMTVWSVDALWGEYESDGSLETIQGLVGCGVREAVSLERFSACGLLMCSANTPIVTALRETVTTFFCFL